MAGSDGTPDSRDSLASVIAPRPCALEGRVEQRDCLVELPNLQQELGELRAKLRSLTSVEFDGAAEKQQRGLNVAVQPRRLRSCDEQFGCLPRKRLRGRVGRAELGAVAVGLLEVVADDLVAFDERRAGLVEPAREALVQLGARCLRQRVVGRVSDQQVAEAIGIGTRELRPVGTDELLADERRRAAARPTAARARVRRRPRCGRAALRRRRVRAPPAPTRRADRVAPQAAP